MKDIEGSNATSVNVKAQFNNDIRRFALAAPSFATLAAHLRSLFAVPVDSAVDLLYKDNEGDFVTMSTDEELQYAIQTSHDLIRLVVRLAGVPSPAPPAFAPAPFPFGGGFHRGGRWGGPERQMRLAPMAPGASPFGPATGTPGEGPQFIPRWGGHHGHRWGGPEGLSAEAKKEWMQQHGFKKMKHCDDGDEKDAKLVARHVKDVTIPDGMQLLPKTCFIKTWRIRNEGGEWPEGCRLMFVSKHRGDIMGAPEFVPIAGKVAPGTEIDVSVNMVAPEEPGHYNGFWKMCTAEGKKFGQRLWVSIQVMGNSSSSSEESRPAPMDGQLDAQVKQIQEMGFEFPQRKVERLLRKFGGNVEVVAQVLLKKQAKGKGGCRRH